MTVNSVFETIRTFMGDSHIFVVFICCTISLYSKMESNQKKSIIVVIAGLFFVLNDIVRDIIVKFGMGGEYYRFLWILPVIPVVAGSGVCLLRKCKNKKEKIGYILAFTVLLSLLGSNYLDISKFKMIENVYGVPEDVIEVTEIINSDKEEVYVSALLDQSMLRTIRTYEASIIGVLDIETYFSDTQNLENAANEGELESYILFNLVQYGKQEDSAVVKKCLQNKDIDYIIVLKTLELDEYMNILGYGKIGESMNYEVYKCSESIYTLSNDVGLNYSQVSRHKKV